MSTLNSFTSWANLRSYLPFLCLSFLIPKVRLLRIPHRVFRKIEKLNIGKHLKTSWKHKCHVGISYYFLFSFISSLIPPFLQLSRLQRPLLSLTSSNVLGSCLLPPLTGLPFLSLSSPFTLGLTLALASTLPDG